MKKRALLLVLTLSFLCICLPACGDTPDTPFELGDQCFYFWGGNNRNLVRGDIATRRSSLPCPDPLCEHGENCPVGNISQMNAVTEKRIYFSKDVGYRFNGDLYCYDLENGKIELIFSALQIAPTFGFVGEKAYFSASYGAFTEEGSLEQVLWDIYQYNPNTKQVQKLNQNSYKDACILKSSIQTKQGMKLIWEVETKYLETDVNFQNVIEVEKPALPIYQGYQYVITPHVLQDGNLSFNVEQLNVKTQERKMVAEKIAPYFRFFRETPESEPTGLLCQFLNEPDCYRRVYLIHFSDLSQAVFLEMSNEYAISLRNNSEDRLQIGPYLAFRCGRPKEGGEFGSWSLYVVDLRTREGFFITK